MIGQMLEKPGAIRTYSKFMASRWGYSIDLLICWQATDMQRPGQQSFEPWGSQLLETKSQKGAGSHVEDFLGYGLDGMCIGSRMIHQLTR